MGNSDAMTAPTSPTATRADEGSFPRIQADATSVPQRKRIVRRLVFTILAALAVALLLSAAVCLLPEDAYQRWRLMDDNMDGRLRWIYERIHFDPRPIDVAIVGPSRAQLGFSAAAIEQDLAERGKPANVVNFAVPGDGRDIQWAILDELLKAKSPKAVVLEVDDQPYPFGHFAFKYVAPADAIVFPPSPFLHNYLYNLAYLPVRKLKLFGANLFPDLFGLPKQFDPEHYAQNRTDYSTSFIGDGKLVDMEHPVPRATLLAEPHAPVPRTLMARAFARLNGGEDHLYIEKIAREAKAHGTQLVFVYMPMFEGPPTISDLDFLKQYGLVMNDGDLASRDELFENWSHLNHAGAMTASARLADAIVGLDPQDPTSKREPQ
jgi:hypothetical protein